MFSRFRLLAVLLCCLGATALIAQTSATTGQIRGRVVDTSGSILPGVTVTATNIDTGLNRSTVTESNGEYQFPLLPPGRYRVTGELAGFGNAQRTITVLLGSTTTADLSINPQLAQEITVTAAAPLVDTREAGLTTSVTENQIENLPVLGRDFRDLALLTPGVVTTFGERITAGGGRGITADYNIDGADTNSDFFGEQRGGTRAPFTFSQAAIREFQVIRSTYSAEYAKGVGATLNAITKSGTNQITGQAFWYQRDEEWASSRPTTFGGQNINDSFDAKTVAQYGFALGGPILRDQLFFFLNADLQDFSRVVNPNDFRNAASFQALPAATQQAFIARVESLLGYSIDREFRFNTTEDQKTYLGKIDWIARQNHNISLRSNWSQFTNEGSEGSNVFSNQGVFDNKFNTSVLQAHSIFGPTLLNEAMLQFSSEDRPRDPFTTSAPRTFVGISGANYTFGQSDFLPNGLTEDRLQFRNSLTWIMNNHTLKGGVEYVQTDVDNLFPRNFAGNYDFQNVAGFLAGTPTRFRQGLGPAGLEMGNNRFDYTYYGVYIQDQWRATDRLTVDAGLRYDTQTVPQPIRNVTAYPELTDNFRQDKNNWAPRLGFAYDLFADGRSVVRGGTGKYYNYIPSILFADPLAQIGGIFSQVDINCTQRPQDCPAYPGILNRAQFDNAALTSSALRIVSPELEAMESLRSSLGYEQQLGTSYSVGIEGTYAKLDKQQRFVGVNAMPTGLTYGDLIVYNINNPNRAYPTLGNVQMHTSDAEGEYTALTLSTRKMAVGPSRFSWLAHYTWSEAIDMDSNERSTSTSFSIDPYNPQLSRGPADYDVRHKVVVSGTYELPLGIMVSGIYNWRTGQPYTRAISGLNNGLGSISVFVPVFRDGSGNVVDMTQATGMSPQQLSAFLAGSTMEGRNLGRHPNFQNLDLRISRRFALFGPADIELIGEIFNVLNEENRVVPGANQNMFVGSFNNAQQRWTFTRNDNFGNRNAYAFQSDPRQYQLAAKVRF
jgi:outer membrane receptor protein involved in Fe transport